MFNNLSSQAHSLKGQLVIDITHTYRFTYVTGIQRVVRRLLKELIEMNLPFKAVRFDDKIGMWLEVSDFQWLNQKPAQTKISKYQIYQKAKKYIPYPILKFLMSFRRFLLKLKIERSLRRPPSRSSNPEDYSSQQHKMLDLSGCHLLIVEYIEDQTRLQELIRLCKNKIVASSTMLVYDLIPLKYPQFFVSNKPCKNYVALIEACEKVMTISDAVGEDVKTLAKNFKGSVETCYLGADIKANFAELEKTSPPNVLCVGTLEPRKNHLRLLQVIETLVNSGIELSFTIVGNPGFKTEEIEHKIELMQKQKYPVRLALSISDTELDQLYRTSLFSVYLSLEEGFGLPILESVARGTPVLTSDRGCMKEIAKLLGGAHLANPENEGEIEEAFRRLLSDQELLEKLKTECRNYKWPSWQDFARRLYEQAY